jgi:glycosyltransferase involved in cell wall biosynthesis
MSAAPPEVKVTDAGAPAVAGAVAPAVNGTEPGTPAPTGSVAPAVTAIGSPRSLRIAIIAANTFEYDSRLMRTARALAGDGHRVTILAFAAPGLPRSEILSPGDAATVGSAVRPGRLDLVRLDVDRRVTSGFRPIPGIARRGLARLLGFPPDAASLPPAAPTGLDRLRAPVRRVLEIAAHQRRVGPWRDAVVRAVPDADVYHCKALIALPVARGAARRAGARFAYDLADLHTEAARLARMPSFVRSAIRNREAGWLRDAALLTAVSDGVAREAARRFHVQPPVVVPNCPSAWRPNEPAPPVFTRLRTVTGIPADHPIVLYQGGFSIDRGIEELVAALDEPALREIGAAVVLLGYGRLRDRLVTEAAARPGRLFVLDAVPPSELLEWTASADLGFVGQPPRTLNQRLNLANKLFESIMAGVPVVVAEGTEHCRLVTEESIGACCDVESPASVARAAASILGAPPDERRRLREHCRAVALERWTWERRRVGLVEAYRSLAAARRTLAAASTEVAAAAAEANPRRSE